MPTEVIKQIHRLAITAEKYEGIVFYDIHGNILTDQWMDDDTSHIETGNIEDVKPSVHITGVEKIKNVAYTSQLNIN